VVVPGALETEIFIKAATAAQAALHAPTPGSSRSTAPSSMPSTPPPRGNASDR
jgi:hypothetical protein